MLVIEKKFFHNEKSLQILKRGGLLEIPKGKFIDGNES